ncbi:hypothetical protein NPIL_59441 [Nephila pilipes]|uniref:Uncharacterized protein n=1 Tax=Nephila pilipes TaxID=299642 RepID=A0A8X6PSQ2_NEPPI|nr:hypothetical protein NPIL_59441 [Nephila pilipes]
MENQAKNIIKHRAFIGGRIMAWTGILSGYRTEMHIFKGSMIATWNREKITGYKLRLCTPIDIDFLSVVMFVYIDLTTLVSVWRGRIFLV